MGTTPIYKIPYIEPGDALAAFPVSDKNQALGVEAGLTTRADWGYAQQSANQSVPSAVATPLASMALISGSKGVTLSGNSLRIATAGLYLITAWMVWGASASGTRALWIRRNASNLMRVTGINSTNGSPSLTATYVAVLAVADLVDVSVYQSSGAAVSTDSSQASVGFQVVQLSY